MYIAHARTYAAPVDRVYVCACANVTSRARVKPPRATEANVTRIDLQQCCGFCRVVKQPIN